MRGDGQQAQDALALFLAIAVFAEAVQGHATHHVLRARADGQAVHLDTDQQARAGTGGRGDAHQRIELLGEPVRYRSPLGDRRLRLDVDLGTQGFLSLDDLLGHASGERLDVGEGSARKPFSEIFHDLAEARHVHARMFGTEIGEEVERRIEQLGLATVRDRDDAAQIGDTSAAEGHGHGRPLQLRVSPQLTPWVLWHLPASSAAGDDLGSELVAGEHGIVVERDCVPVPEMLTKLGLETGIVLGRYAEHAPAPVRDDGAVPGHDSPPMNT